MLDPEEKLAPNKDIAMKIYIRQVKKLEKNPELRRALIQAELKLHDAGHAGQIYHLNKDNC